MNSTPSAERRRKKPYVVIECPEKIPCDPCVEACPQGAISIKGSMIELPEVDYEKCTGCLVCIPRCPGLAIFVVDETPPDHSVVYLPYEFLPRPKKGDAVAGIDRDGKKRCDAKVVKVLDSPKFDRCAVVGIAVPKELASEIRFIRQK
jgi:Fe-S-cluster-containing hydrogenase component 2